MSDLQSPRGTRDILPEDQPYWSFVLETINKKSTEFGFEKIELPTFEDEKVFTKAIGAGTDIVDKEIFSVSRNTSVEEKEDAKSKLVLRPEGTAGAIRAYIEHGMVTWPQPVRLWYSGSMFRYERPQKGRYREFKQFGVELVNDESPAADALLISLAWEISYALGIADNLIVDINTLGCKTCRPKIRKSLIAHFSKQKSKLCKDCQRRLDINPLRILDCKEPGCDEVKQGAPQIIDLVDDECKKHFQSVLEYLDDLNIPYNLAPFLVRGLDYYTRTAFEVRDRTDDRRQSSLIAGGRYDGLIELMGGKSTPAVGFGMGLDRIVDIIKETNAKLPQQSKTDACIIQIGDKARHVALTLVQELTRAGIRVVTAPGKDALKGQLRLANKVNAKFALIIGQQEALTQSVIIKNLDDSAQETVPRKHLLNRLQKILLNN